MMTSRIKRIALLFNANRAFNRQVLSGIAECASSSRANWELLIEEDTQQGLSAMHQWQADGIIADFDDPAIGGALAACPIPTVAVCGSYGDAADYRTGTPYVTTDNYRLIELAYRHLIDTGLRHFALFSLPDAAGNRWAMEREKAFHAVMRDDQVQPEVFRGEVGAAVDWEEAARQQIAWLNSLPKPVGIIAVSDARAHQLMRACGQAGIAVPEEVAVVGIDDDALMRTLTRIPLSSVAHNGAEIGSAAVKLLKQMLHGIPIRNVRQTIAPAGINVLPSSQHSPGLHPRVMHARHYIRRFACLGIKAEQVASYVGISLSALYGYFRAEVGCSVHDEILRVRLETAQAMMGNGSFSIAEVARRCGFTSSQYMHAVFRRELGCTPREFQARLSDPSHHSQPSQPLPAC